MAERIIDRLIIEYETRYNDQGFRRLEQGLTRFESRMNKIRLGLINFSNAFAGVGAGLTGGLFLVTRQMYNFERSLNRVGAVSRASAEDMARFEDQARQLGATTEYSASQAAGAQQAFSQAGFEVNQTLSATPGILNLAAAGQLEMAEASAITAKTLRQFNLEASESGRIADVLAEVAANTLTDVQKMGRALAFSGVAANTLKVSLEETSAALGVLQNEGITGFRAGTNLRAIFSRMAGPTNIAAKEIERLGINIDELTKIVTEGGVIEALEMLNEAGLDFVSARKIFEQEVAPAALILSREAEAVRELTVQLQNAEGAAKDMALRTNQGLVGALRRLRSVSEELLIALGRAGIVQAVTAVANVLSVVIRFVSDLPGPLRAVIALLLISGPLWLATAIGLRAIAFALNFATISATRNAAAQIANALFLRKNAYLRGLAAHSAQQEANAVMQNTANQLQNTKAQQDAAIANFRRRIGQAKAAAEQRAATSATQSDTAATQQNTFAKTANTTGVRANTAAKNENIAASFRYKGAKAAENVAHVKNTNQILKEVRARNASKVATDKDTISNVINTKAKNANTVSSKANTTATHLGSRAGAISAAVKLRQAIATGVATSAQWALNAAMYASPLVWAIGLTVALTAAIAGLTYGWEKLNRSMRDSNDLLDGSSVLSSNSRYVRPSNLTGGATTNNIQTRNNFHVDRVQIDAQGADAREIAADLKLRLEQEFQSANRQSKLSNVVL